MPITVEVPTAEDVLRLAAELIASPLPHEWAACDYNLGPYCPRCAAAHAATKLGQHLPLGWTDGALETAVFYMAAPAKALSRAAATVVVKKAIKASRLDGRV